MKFNSFVEFNGQKYNVKELENRFKEMWKEKGGLVKDVKTVELYIKPEEKACYYLITDTSEGGRIDLS